MQITELERFNHWWRTGQVKALPPFKRTLYQDLSSYLAMRQILLIRGLRRTGKSTLLYQLIASLLEQNKPIHLLYFSFDELAFDIKEVLETYQKFILGKPFDQISDKIYLFLDEIQKVPDWENKLKVYYDLYPHLKIVVSGSAAVSLKKKGRESLAGRIFDFVLEPLSFTEFLAIKGYDLVAVTSNPKLWQRELLSLSYQYLKWGMFPELVLIEDEQIARKYLLESVIDRIIYKDIIEEFKVTDVELLKNLVYILGKTPGMIVNFKQLGNNLGRDERTISNYFEYLEFGLLTRFVFNYRGSPLASRRKSKKVYFSTPNLIFALNSSLETVLPAMLENIVCTHAKATFFYRNSFEVDFIFPEGRAITKAIEVKSNRQEIKQLLKLRSKFGNNIDSFLLTFEEEGEEQGIQVIPLWKWLLEPLKSEGKV